MNHINIEAGAEKEKNKPKPWKKMGAPRILAESRGRKLFIQQYIDPHTDEVENFTLFGFTGLSSIVFAVTTEEKVLVVSQYRHAQDFISLELPGGASKYLGQSPEDIAREELAEETRGYEPKTVIPLMKNNGLVESILASPIHPFLFLGCRKKSGNPAKRDKGEYIELFTLAIEKWIAMCQTGQIRDVRSIAVTVLAQGYLNSIGWKL